MSSSFDLWLMYCGNPEEMRVERLTCSYCEERYEPEDGDADLCRSCLNAGVFRCECCLEWKAADQQRLEDLCAACADAPPHVFITTPVARVDNRARSGENRGRR